MRPETWWKLPVVDRQELREHNGSRKSTAPPLPSVQKQTSGTTGEPLLFGYEPDSEYWRHAVRLRAYEWAGYRPGDRALYFLGSPGTLGASARHAGEDRARPVPEARTVRALRLSRRGATAAKSFGRSLGFVPAFSCVTPRRGGAGPVHQPQRFAVLVHHSDRLAARRGSFRAIALDLAPRFSARPFSRPTAAGR